MINNELSKSILHVESGRYISSICSFNFDISEQKIQFEVLFFTSSIEDEYYQKITYEVKVL